MSYIYWLMLGFALFAMLANVMVKSIFLSFFCACCFIGIILAPGILDWLQYGVLTLLLASMLQGYKYLRSG